MNALISAMDMDPRDVLSPEEIDQALEDAFKKFDDNGNGTLSFQEFIVAWLDLGLKGQQNEIQEQFESVDTNNSGTIDLQEFKRAIKGARMVELNLKFLLDK